MNDLPIEASTFLAAVVTWTLYGCYASLFVACMRVLFWRQQQNRWVILSLVSLFVFVTVHVCLYSNYVYNAFVVNIRRGGTISYLGLYHRPVIGADYLSYWLCNIITESLILWRVFTVWRGTSLWYMVVPGTLYLGNLGGSTYFVAVHVHQAVLGYDRKDKRNYTIMIITATVLLVQNFIASGMIAGRLWYMGRLVSCGKTRFPYKCVIRAVVESAALYSAAWLALVVATSCKMFHATDIILKALFILVGIVPTLMWFSTNFKLAADSARGRPVPAIGDISSMDLEDGQTFTEWRFAPTAGPDSPYVHVAKYMDSDPEMAVIAYPKPSFARSEQSSTAWTASTPRGASPI